MKKIIFILYTLTLLLLVLFSYGFIDPNLIYYKKIFSNFAFENRLATTLLYSLFIVVLFLFYFAFIFLVSQKKLHMKEIKFLIMITCVILLFAYPAMLSYDIFNYIVTAKVLFFYHENPYIIMPMEFTGDPMLLFTHAANKVALYGPGWILFTGIPHVLGMGNFFITIMSFKLMAIVFYLLVLVLIWRLSRNLLSLSLFAFNPLILIEVLLGNHNDIVMLVLTLLSFLSIKKKHYFLAICFFLGSVLIKYATIFLLPVFLFLLWKAYKQREINWQKIYFASFIAMLLVFFLSPLREEMYPWYAVWFLPFIFLIPDRKNVLYLSIAFSFGLLLRYVPFMYSGTHFGITPVLRILLASLPLGITALYLLLSSRLKWRSLIK